MRIPKAFVLCGLLALAGMPPVPVQAAVITGVTIEGFSSQLAGGFNRLAVHTVDGSGFEPNGPGTHTTSPNNTMWLSNGTFTTPNDPIGAFPNSYIEFNLGDNYVLESFTVWNYNEATSQLFTRGANLVNISVASEVGGTFTSLGNFNFNIAPGANNVDFGQSIDLSSFAAAEDVRLVRFDILSNHGGDNNFVGLSEVRFFGTVVPEPSSATLIGLSGLMLLLRRRR